MQIDPAGIVCFSWWL